jgi:hypothetical protein
MFMGMLPCWLCDDYDRHLFVAWHGVRSWHCRGLEHQNRIRKRWTRTRGSGSVGMAALLAAVRSTQSLCRRAPTKESYKCSRIETS